LQGSSHRAAKPCNRKSDENPKIDSRSDAYGLFTDDRLLGGEASGISHLEGVNVSPPAPPIPDG
jgi:hypothetical protein